MTPTIDPLRIPLRMDDIEFRLAKVYKNEPPKKSWGKLLAYGKVDSLRARLDAACGHDWSWEVNHCSQPACVIGTLSVLNRKQSGVATGVGAYAVRTAHDDAFRHACRGFGLGALLWHWPDLRMELSREWKEGWLLMWLDEKKYYVYPPNTLIPDQFLPTQEQVSQNPTLFPDIIVGGVVSSPGLFEIKSPQQEEKPEAQEALAKCMAFILGAKNPKQLSGAIAKLITHPIIQGKLLERPLSAILSQIEVLAIQATDNQTLADLSSATTGVETAWPEQAERCKAVYARIDQRGKDLGAVK